ncbi:MAG TPA: nucleoside deaminase [Bacteroidia bacterium]|jgi:tRNA(adenine34) deaminase|nr:nucleoside deaminase [Bacteroidia bacterium]
MPEKHSTQEPSHSIDERFMREALKEAKRAYALDEVPIGAVIVCNGVIIARGHNLTEQLTDVTAHAEMQAFTSASNYLGGKYLQECTLYVTVEPCVMCAGAAFWTQITRIVYGAPDPKRGFMMVGTRLLHPKTKISSGILEEECSVLMKTYFEGKRDKGR